MNEILLQASLNIYALIITKNITTIQYSKIHNEKYTICLKIHHKTRINATRFETLRTVTIDFRTHFIDGFLKRSILIYHNQYLI